MRVNKNCSAQELHAIMQDHFELLQSLGEMTLGKHASLSPRQMLQKSKKKKFSTEMDEKSNKREDFLNYQRMFSVFEQNIKGQEMLLTQLLVHNKTCEKEKNQPLQDVFLKV